VEEGQLLQLLLLWLLLVLLVLLLCLLQERRVVIAELQVRCIWQLIQVSKATWQILRWLH
jgi:hypothetical protein